MQAEEIDALKEYYLKRREQEKQMVETTRSSAAARIHTQLQRLHEMMLHDLGF